MSNTTERATAQKTGATGYFERPEINCSSLKLILQAPALYQHQKTTPRTETKAMKVGSAVHCLTLEPSVFVDAYAVAPAVDKRTKEGKQVWAELEETGKTILSIDEFELVQGVSEAVQNHPTASKLLSEGIAEHEIYTSIDGVPAKAKLDWYRNGFVIDLKTTEDASPSGFRTAVAKYKYAIQAAWYLDCCAAAGMNATEFIFIAVEKSAPYLIGIYVLSEADIERGRADYQKALALYCECESSGVWRGYSPHIETLTDLPSWAFANN